MTTRKDKTEHEKLKEIADEIGYDYLSKWIEYDDTYCDEFEWPIWFWIDQRYREVQINVREIIFTQEFMDKYIKYTEKNWIIAPSKYKTFLIDLHKNLDNSVDYLYNTIWLWK